MKTIYKQSDHKRMRKKQGSMILEIILSLAIFSIICFPILIFIFSGEQFQNKKSKRESDVYKGIAEANISWFDSKNLEQESNAHSCDLAFSYLLEKSDNSAGNSVGDASLNFNVSYPNWLTSIGEGIISSLQFVIENNKKYLFAGSNSASTTDADFHIVEMHSDVIGLTGLQLGAFDTGPGIVELRARNGVLYATERSIVHPIWYLPVDSAIHAVNQEAFDSQRNFIALPIQQSYPHALSVTADGILVGLEKNISNELLFFRRFDFNNGAGTSGTQSTQFVLSSVAEIGAGVNDIEVGAGNGVKVFVATPQNPELIVFDLAAYSTADSAASSSAGSSANEFRLWKKFDAPGSSGNGKSLATYKNHLILGRTVGNDELFFLSSDVSNEITKGSFNINESILQVEELFGGQYVLVLTKSLNKSLVLLKKDKTADGSFKFIEKKTLTLPLVPTSMTCTKDNVIIGLENSITPLAIISLQR